jgi:thiol:disulfide interchange protein DsbA
MKTLIATVLLLVLPPAWAQTPVPVAGRDYVEIRNGRPLEPSDGAIVVEEYFSYACPACNAFEPHFVAWAAELPRDVRVEHVPASFRRDFVQYARAYYAAHALGVDGKTHQAVYDGIHRTRRLPAEGELPDEARIARFYAGFGVDADGFLAAMRSFGVESKVRRAAEHMKRSKIPSTPSLVVNGRYLVGGDSYAEMLRIARYLIEQERSSR